MDYNIVEIKEKIVAGKVVRTNNNSADMPQKMDFVWKNFFKIYKDINNKIDKKCLGVYTNYESDFKGDYDIMVCCEVDKTDNLNNDISIIKIPSQKYAEFTLNNRKEIPEFWQKIWNMDLNRKYSYDFEEYEDISNIDECKVKIHIALI